MRGKLAATLLGLNVFAFGCLTLLMFHGHHPRPNFVPFRSIVHDWRIGGMEFTVNFLGNLAIFVPIGFLSPLSRRRPTNGWQVAGMCMLLSVSIEVMQYLSHRRVADVDDILLNTTGGILGYFLLRVWNPASSGKTG